MKKLIRLAILIYILGKGSSMLGRAIERLPEKVDISRRMSESSGYADELFRELGFEPQNPRAS
jgi:hypothetical protein